MPDRPACAPIIYIIILCCDSGSSPRGSENGIHVEYSKKELCACTVPFSFKYVLCLGLRARCDKCLAGIVALILCKVLDETICEILGSLGPLLAVRIGISRIQNGRIHTRQFGRNFKVEERNLLRRCLQNIAVQDGIVSLIEILLPLPFQPVFTR